GSESGPPMLHKENYVPWSSRLLRYAKIRPNGKLIHNSIINGPYVRRMIPESGDTNREILPEWIRHVTIVHQTKDLHTADYTQLYDIPKYYQKENYMQQPMPNPKDITDPTTALNMALALMTKAFKLNYSRPTNNNQRISSNPRNRRIAQPSMNMGQDRQMQMVRGNGENKFRQYAGKNIRNLNGYNAVQNVGNQVIQNGSRNPRVQNIRNQNGLIGVPRNANQNLNGNGNLVVAHAEENTAGHNTEEFDLMAAAADIDKIEEVNANYILMANLQQALTSSTQTDKAPVYDSDGSAEVKSTIVTLQRVVKHRMTLETHNWPSSAHQELHKIVKDEIFPIVNQVDARVQNFERQFLKEAAKFVGDFKSLAKEADDSFAKHKALELQIERLLRAVVSEDIMSVVQKASIVDTSNPQTELERTKNSLKTVSLNNRMNMLNFRMIGIKSVTNANLTKFDTLNPLSQKLKNENVELEF
nr:hypothetical protein [Tanacetum cinerariifolium]